MIVCAMLLVCLLGFVAVCSLIRACWVKKVYGTDDIKRILREQNRE